MVDPLLLSGLCAVLYNNFCSIKLRYSPVWFQVLIIFICVIAGDLHNKLLVIHMKSISIGVPDCRLSFCVEADGIKIKF